jgi:phytoene dehydrogenase-like protein
MAVIMAMLGQTVGFPVPEGGAGELSASMARRFEAYGGEVRTGCHVDAISVKDRRAKAVILDSGEVIAARRAILADVAAPVLYGGLVDWKHLPERTRRGIDLFQWDPATVKVDWALDRPVPWETAPDVTPGTVHIADSTDQMMAALQQISAHSVPAEPFLLAGQMTSSDPTRSPAGTESLWAYTHVPQEVHADAGGEGIRGLWDYDEAERFADRMQARIEKYAPGFSSTIVSRRVLSPLDLQRRDVNLVRGAINGGTAELHQELIFRPVPGLGRAGTPVRGLFLASASAHPGGGVHGAAGSNAARAALTAHRTGRLTP